MRLLRASVIAFLPAVLPIFAQQAGPWRDPSPHKVQFVTVDKDVKLEVLDWGGTGRPLVLLAGSGNTAHVFDGFAEKLIDSYHVYGITRRGFGASSHPDSWYTDQRLADDALQVLDALNIAASVLAGHSMAGSELTTLGAKHSDRLSGLIYLEALRDPTRDYSGLTKELPWQCKIRRVLLVQIANPSKHFATGNGAGRDSRYPSPSYAMNMPRTRTEAWVNSELPQSSSKQLRLAPRSAITVTSVFRCSRL